MQDNCGLAYQLVRPWGTPRLRNKKSAGSAGYGAKPTMSASALIKRIIAIAIPAALALGGSFSLARAAAGPWGKTDFVEARLVAAVDGTGALSDVPLGLELKLKPNWKTYWRSPGDAGLPPALDWAGSANLKAATLAYPAPHRFILLKSQTFGYKDHVVYPVSASVATPGQALDLKARLDVLVCAEICVPQSLDLALQIPAGAALPGAEAQLVNQFQSQVPLDDAASDIKVLAAKTLQDGTHVSLEIEAQSDEPFSAPDVFAETEPDAAFGAPVLRLSDNNHRAILTMALSGDLPAGATMAGRPVTITLVDGLRAVEHKAIIAAGAGAGQMSSVLTGIFMFGFALLGGLILNLMPCVLPVLSLKLMSLVKYGKAPPATVRANFLATAAGIIFSLLLLASGLIALKSAGLAVGWGIQFQQPVFIAAVAVIVALFACNLWGFFEIVLPSGMTNFAGQAGGDGSGLIGNFVIGAFATLLATPCSAPFVGTAVGFALAGGPAQILLIFLALGIGLASPYLAIAAWPAFARYIPRPGTWMIRLRQFLGFALAATAVWLLTILPAQIGMPSTLVVSALIVAMVVALACGEWLPRLPHVSGRAAAAVLALAAIGLPLLFGARVAGSGGKSETIAWVKFDRDQIKSLVSQGKTVFVDVTADWCVVCQSNKKLVTNTDSVSQRITALTVPMKADWTSPDAKIAAFLSSFGRYGIPMNVVFGPDAPAGILLPELLTQDAVLKAIDKASGKTATSALQLELRPFQTRHNEAS